MSTRGAERSGRVRDRLREEKWDALICAMPANVLMLSGYWPVVGTGAAVFSAEGELTLLVPEDEEEMARRSWAAKVLTFQSSSLDNLNTAAEAISGPLSKLIGGYKRIGFENGEETKPASYVAMHVYSGAMRNLLEQASPRAELLPAGEALSHLKTIKTAEEIGAIRRAAKVAGDAFVCGANVLRAGITEARVLNRFGDWLYKAASIGDLETRPPWRSLMTQCPGARLV